MVFNRAGKILNTVINSRRMNQDIGAHASKPYKW